jgi:hypothetical protein
MSSGSSGESEYAVGESIAGFGGKCFALSKFTQSSENMQERSRSSRSLLLIPYTKSTEWHSVSSRRENFQQFGRDGRKVVDGGRFRLEGRASQDSVDAMSIGQFRELGETGAIADLVAERGVL